MKGPKMIAQTMASVERSASRKWWWSNNPPMSSQAPQKVTTDEMTDAPQMQAVASVRFIGSASVNQVKTFVLLYFIITVLNR